MLLRARIVLPITQPPIADGFVRLAGNRITEVGAWVDLADSSGAEDLGEVILMPGLVNAHCHLDYTDFIGAIPPQKSFTDWINALVDLKRDVNDAAHCQSWLRGAQQSLRHGVTTLGNIETRWNHLPELWRQTPLRFVSFLELIVLQAESDSRKALAEAMDWARANPPPRGSLGVSPHAPYTTKCDLLEACAKMPELPIAIHIAESAEEDEMFRCGTGALHARMAEAGRDMGDCGNHSPLLQVTASGVLNKNVLIIHGNYLDDADVQAVALCGASLVHCPRSHRYFGHAAFRFSKLESAGVNLCLGTDSLATMREPEAKLDLFSEMQLFREHHPGLPSEQLMQMATTHPAAALSLEGRVGEIGAGAFADFVAIPFSGSIESAATAVVEHSGEVQRVMIYGQWQWPEPSSPVDHAQ
jgi:cytosine/adenosine deaminase-related metal-dependent hydrolase